MLGYAEGDCEAGSTKSASDLGDRWAIIAMAGAKECDGVSVSDRFACQNP